MLADLRVVLGWARRVDEVLDRGERITDRWAVVGLGREDDGRLQSQRTWLYGQATGRVAVVLDFAAAGASLAVAEVLGSVVEAELALYPGSDPRRALFTGERSVVGSAAPLPATGVDEALDQVATWLAANPFGDRFPLALAGVVPVAGASRAAGGRARRRRTAAASRQRRAVAAGPVGRGARRPVRRVGRLGPHTAERPRRGRAGGVVNGGDSVAVASPPTRPPTRPVAALWRDLLSAALVGTARRPAPALGDLGVVVEPGPDAVGPPPEHRSPGADGAGGPAGLLASAAVLAALRRAGHRPEEAPRRLPVPAGADARPACSAPAVDVLELILSGEVPIPGGVALLARQWLDGAARAGCRLPARLLPRLLDLGSTASDLRPGVGAVAGPRGRWLAGHSERWSWAAAEPVDAGEGAGARFATASRAERVALLDAVRTADPARGRDLLAGSWAGEPAAERATLLAGLAAGLSADDEPFLEAALDDRSAAVRQVAADLLGRLPSSRRSARMAERLRPLVTTSGIRGRTLVVGRPPEPDAAARRDGIADAAPSGMGVSAWRTLQLVAGAPLAFWADHLGRDPVGVVALAAGAGESGAASATPVLAGGQRVAPANPVLLGLEQAVAAQAGRSDPAWAAALFASRPTPVVLGALPPAGAATVLARRLEEGLAPGPAAAALLAACPGPWPETLGDAVLDRYRQLGAKAALELPAALPVLADRLAPSALPLVETWAFALAGDQGLRRRVQTLGHALSLRAVIQREFPS